MKTSLKRGHAIRHTSTFLRSTCQVAGAPVNGVVLHVDKRAPAIVTAQWCDRDDGDVTRILAGNVELTVRDKRHNATVTGGAECEGWCGFCSRAAA